MSHSVLLPAAVGAAQEKSDTEKRELQEIFSLFFNGLFEKKLLSPVENGCRKNPELWFRSDRFGQSRDHQIFASFLLALRLNEAGAVAAFAGPVCFSFLFNGLAHLMTS